MPYTILLIDDDNAYRAILKRWLERAGYSVVEAIHGRQALQHLREVAVDLIVTDIFMPEADGLETIQKLADFPALKGVIALSSHIAPIAGFSYLQCAKELGANAVFTKPVEKEQLLAQVQNLLSPFIPPGAEE